MNMTPSEARRAKAPKGARRLSIIWSSRSEPQRLVAPAQMDLSSLQGNLLESNRCIASMQANVCGFRRGRDYLKVDTGGLWSPRRRSTAMARNGIHHVTAISGPAGRNVDFY